MSFRPWGTCRVLECETLSLVRRSQGVGTGAGRTRAWPPTEGMMDTSQRSENGRAYVRARQVFLGEGERVRDPGSLKLQRIRGDAILKMGEGLHLFISENGIEGFFESGNFPDDDIPEIR